MLIGSKKINGVTCDGFCSYEAKFRDAKDTRASRRGEISA